jgi:hypothetical protein
MMDALDRAIASTQAHLEALRARQRPLGRAIFQQQRTVHRHRHRRAVTRGSRQTRRPHRKKAHAVALRPSKRRRRLGRHHTQQEQSLHHAALLERAASGGTPSSAMSDEWITAHVGSLDPKAIARAVITRYGKDKTFSVPILMLCALVRHLGERRLETRHRTALRARRSAAHLVRCHRPARRQLRPAGAHRHRLTRGFKNAPPAWWNPLRWLRALAWPRIRPMLQTLQPAAAAISKPRR